MAVEITTDPTFIPGNPVLLPVEVQFSRIGNWDVFPDGERFLILQLLEENQSIAQINIVQDWFEELKRLVPTGNK